MKIMEAKFAIVALAPMRQSFTTQLFAENEREFAENEMKYYKSRGCPVGLFAKVGEEVGE